VGNRLPGLSIDPQLECERGNQVVLGSSSGNLNLPPGTVRAGESAARSHVTNQLGYEIVGTNYRTREGEIDIVAGAGAWPRTTSRTRTGGSIRGFRRSLSG